jgi:hypothetical protein
VASDGDVWKCHFLVPVAVDVWGVECGGFAGAKDDIDCCGDGVFAIGGDRVADGGIGLETGHFAERMVLASKTSDDFVGGAYRRILKIDLAVE